MKNNVANWLGKRNLIREFDDLTKTWHLHCLAPKQGAGSLTGATQKLHYFNFKIWHEEDEARRTDVDDSIVAATKRRIDKLNQLRNNTIELFDELMLIKLKQAKKDKTGEGGLNSETPGSMIDRISVLSLKIYHMRIESNRRRTGPGHLAQSKTRLKILKTQRKDLAGCFNSLVDGIITGKMYFKIYKQFKMYNDPKFNPALYGKKS